MSRKCIGCGVSLQSDNENLPGFIPSDKVDAKYCMRCYKIIHYNGKIATKLDNINDKVLNDINKKKGIKFFLVDFLNINSETMEMFKRINGEKMLLISKFDYVPKSIRKDNIVKYLASEYGILEYVDFISAKKKFNTGIIYKLLETNNVGEGYVLGFTNSGKSNLINELCLKMDLEGNITTSNLPNTTLDYIKIDILDKVIYDTPGFLLDKNFYKENEFDLINRINPKDVINPITYQMKEDTRLVIEDRISFCSDVVNSFTFYMSNMVKIDKYFKDVVSSFSKIIHVPNDSDIVIKGLGFINVKKSCDVTVCGEYVDLIEVRKSMFGGSYE